MFRNHGSIPGGSFYFMLVLSLILIAGVFSSQCFAEYLLEDATVEISHIQPDGSVHVKESIKIFVKGDNEQSAYLRGFENNELSYWSSLTKIKDLKIHLDPTQVTISNLRVKPQPLRKCNPIEKVCHGEIIIEYDALPYTNASSGEPIEGTGLFFVEKSKPRTWLYSINPKALAFRNSDEEKDNIILNENVHLKIILPDNSRVMDVNPLPSNVDVHSLPARFSELEWEETVLVKFSLVFEVEEPLTDEVKEFFFGIFTTLSSLIWGKEGPYFLFIVGLIIVSYLYILLSKKEKPKR